MNINELRYRVTSGLINLVELRGTANRMEAQLQPILREFVTNKEISLGERFECWSRHCVKDYKGNITGNSSGDLIEQIIYADCPMCSDIRGIDFAWDYFVDFFEEDEKFRGTDGWCESCIEQFGVTLDEFKEFLITENFGHFTWDW